MKRTMLIMAILAVTIPCAVCAEETSGENLAPNPSFELPENGVGQTPTDWQFFTSKLNTMAITDEETRTGKQALKMSAQKAPKQYQGLNIALPVEEGEQYSFNAFVISSKKDRIGGSAHGMLVIEWKREDGSEISRTLSTIWQASSLSRLRWEQISLTKEPAPKGAAKGIFGIHLSEGDLGGKGSISIDDITILKN